MVHSKLEALLKQRRVTCYLKVPVIGGSNLGPQQHRRTADSLLDDPAALGHAGDELQHGVPLLVGRCIAQAPL